MDFQKRVFTGVVWSGLSRFIRLGCQLGITVVLARVLMPEDFGLISIALIFTLLGTMIVGLGLGFTVIQRKELTPEQIATSFWVCVLSGVFVSLLTVIFSEPIALFFKKENLGPVLQAMSLINIVWGISLVPKGMLRRDLLFKEIAMSEVFGMIAYGFAAIVLAVKGFGVWSLVVGNLASYLVSTMFICNSCAWKPVLQFSLKSMDELWPYSIKAMSTSILHYGGTNIDYILVGRLLGPVMLGYYSIVYNLVTLPQRHLASILSDVSFSAFSRIQSEDERLKRGYLKNLTYIALVAFPLLVGLSVVAPEFVRVVFGHKWLPAIIPLRILSIAGIFYSLGSLSNILLLAKGRADLDLKMTVLRLVIICVFVFIGSKSGIIGVAAAISIFALIFVPAFQILVNRLIGMDMKDYYRSFAAALWASMIMGAVLLGMRHLLVRFFNAGDLVLLLSSITAGMSVYLLCLKMMRFEQWKELLKLAQ